MEAMARRGQRAQEQRRARAELELVCAGTEVPAEPEVSGGEAHVDRTRWIVLRHRRTAEPTELELEMREPQARFPREAHARDGSEQTVGSHDAGAERGVAKRPRRTRRWGRRR